jgi:methylated-DNA-[protein]-cysteine S-methyltransferase
MIRVVARSASRKGNGVLGSLRPACTPLAAAFATELGWMALAHQDGTLVGIVFGHATQRQALATLERRLGRASDSGPGLDVLPVDQHPAPIAELVAGLKSFAAGEEVEFDDVQIDQRHLTDFGRAVVRCCRHIPFGETRSYGQLAAASGSPGAARAVGQVMATNRYPLVVPCHRVLAAGGQLGGFSAPTGITMKRRLLALEDSNREAG